MFRSCTQSRQRFVSWKALSLTSLSLGLLKDITLPQVKIATFLEKWLA